MRINAKKSEVKKRKRIESQRAKHPTLSKANDALIGNKEQSRIQKITQKIQEQVSNPATLDYLVTSYNTQ